MRSTLDIAIAVKDCGDVSEEELRLCVCSLSAMLYFAEKDRDDLVECITSGKPQSLATFKAQFIADGAESRFTGKKIPVDKYLGPRNIPGTSENTQAIKLGRAIFKAATGESL